jgi:uncharacterized protein YukE
MSKANVDPAELRRFAQELKRFTGDIESLMGQLHARMNALEGSWRDQEQKKFAETFSAATKSLGVFVAAAEEHTVFLTRKAAAIEQYLKQR